MNKAFPATKQPRIAEDFGISLEHRTEDITTKRRHDGAAALEGSRKNSISFAILAGNREFTNVETHVAKRKKKKTPRDENCLEAEVERKAAEIWILSESVSRFDI